MLDHLPNQRIPIIGKPTWHQSQLLGDYKKRQSLALRCSPCGIGGKLCGTVNVTELVVVLTVMFGIWVPVGSFVHFQSCCWGCRKSAPRNCLRLNGGNLVSATTDIDKFVAVD